MHRPSPLRINLFWLAVATTLSSAAVAAPQTYAYQTAGSLTGSIAVITALGGQQGLASSGSFNYDSAAPFLGGSGSLGFEPGYAVFSGVGTTWALSKLQGQLGGRSYSDVVGTVNVGNNLSTPSRDILSISADPTPKLGQNTLPADLGRQLIGFTVGDFALVNVRMIWGASGPADSTFLGSYALPTSLPTFGGVLALDFARVSDPNNVANRPFYENTVFLSGLTVSAVPEPAAAVLALAGVGLLANRRRVARACTAA